jgi:hypothetical protein
LNYLCIERVVDCSCWLLLIRFAIYVCWHHVDDCNIGLNNGAVSFNERSCMRISFQDTIYNFWLWKIFQDQINRVQSRTVSLLLLLSSNAWERLVLIFAKWLLCGLCT